MRKQGKGYIRAALIMALITGVMSWEYSDNLKQKEMIRAQKFERCSRCHFDPNPQVHWQFIEDLVAKSPDKNNFKGHVLLVPATERY